MKTQLLIVTAIALLLMMITSHGVHAWNANVTQSISTNIDPIKVWVGFVPGIASSVKLQASCDTMLCTFYFFDQKQFDIYTNSSGLLGKPIKEYISVLPNTVATLSIDSDDTTGKNPSTFNKRYNGPVYMVIRNLGIHQTHVTGHSTIIVHVPNWLIGVGVGAIVLLALICLFVYIVLPVACCMCCCGNSNSRKRRAGYINLSPNNHRYYSSV